MTRQRPRIEVRVAADGSITAHTIGVSGPRCLDYLPILEELLGAQTVQSAFTAEYHESIHQRRQVEVRHDVREG